jgi:hypothetical protein
MKKFLLLLMVYSMNCYTQTPNPELFQTWYLSSVQTDDGSMGFTVSDISPSISPTLTISNDLTFNGIGACNSFNGEFNLVQSDFLETTQFSNLTNDCVNTTQDDFENEYFSFIQFVSGYQIDPVEGGLMLSMGTVVFGQATFFNFQLNTSDFKLPEIRLFPNPTESTIQLKSQNSSILKIEFYNTSGKKLETINDSFDILDISDFSKGIYFIRIYTNQGIYNEKIIKK